MKLPPRYPEGGSGGPLLLDGRDRIVLGGVAIPGKASVVGASRKFKKDDKKKNGGHGGRPTFTGLDAQDVKLELFTWTTEQEDWLTSFIKPYVPGPGVEPKPISIDAFNIKHLGITHIVIHDVGALIDLPSGGSKMQVTGTDWLPEGDKKTSATKTPKRPIRNIQREDAQGLSILDGTLVQAGAGALQFPASDKKTYAAPSGVRGK